MDTPNKIYLSKLVKAGIETLDKPVSDSDVEYVRTEALLDWLKDKKMCYGMSHDIMQGYRQAISDVIDMLKSD